MKPPKRTRPFYIAHCSSTKHTVGRYSLLGTVRRQRGKKFQDATNEIHFVLVGMHTEYTTCSQGRGEDGAEIVFHTEYSVLPSVLRRSGFVCSFMQL